MTVPAALTSLVGKWQGTNQLWLNPNEPARESASTAAVKLAAQEKFLILEYTWTDNGRPQDGFLLLGQEQQKVTAAWIDSWHMQDVMMLCEGVAEPDSTVWVQGSYAAPPGPDWGWRLSIQPMPNDQFRFVMYNISPDGEEMLAVEVVYSRQDSSG